MKILYITPRINDEGGVARVLSIKANYLAEALDYKIHILTQNKGNSPLFYDFSEKISLHDMVLSGNRIQYLLQYKKALKKHINTINPDIIIVCDNGIKGFLVPYLLQTNIPILFESHGSFFNDEKQRSSNILESLKVKTNLILKKMGAAKFDKFIALSEENKKEWNLKNIEIIPNPNWLTTPKTNALDSNKIISVSRHSHEKGIDRLLLVWQKVIESRPDLILDIYGKSDENKTYQTLANELKLEHNVNFYEPVKNIQEKYGEASMYVMTSRYEGFPMVLIEAMASGLPCIAYDCPVGPAALIKNNYNGFLIKENQTEDFASKVLELINNHELRLQMGQNAQDSVQKYDIKTIMNQWNTLFKSLTKK